VRAPAGKTVVIDDRTINGYNSWAEVGKLQRDPTPNASKLLPHTLVYRLSTPQKLKDPVGPLLRVFASADEAGAEDVTTINRSNTTQTMKMTRSELELCGFGSSEDPAKRLIWEHERMENALFDIFPDLTFTRILDTYKECFGSIQQTVGRFMRSDDPQTETLTLDTITPGQRAETLKWYVQFPHLSVE
jgi:hypothetical protein